MGRNARVDDSSLSYPTLLTSDQDTERVVLTV